MSIIHGNQNTTKLINQLKAATKQYKTLSKKQEEQLIEKYRNNRKKLNQLLFMHNIKIVFNIAKKYTSKTKDFDGLIQDGMIGLGEACERFDLDKGIKFITYAHWWVQKYILQNFDEKRNKIERNSSSINAPNTLLQLKSNNGQEVSFENYINEYIEPTQNKQRSITSELSANEQTEICKQLMDHLNSDTSLSSTDKAIFVDYFYNHEKTRDIADKYSITMQQVNDIRTLILGKLKEVLVNDFKITSYDDVNAM